jgi:uncharacterized membrane protein YsdA (DUF1294 family)
MSDFSTTTIITLAILNGLTFLIFGYDKWMAASHSWRIPEAILWALAAIGGSVGALVGMHIFRHKTKKLSFQLILTLIILVQCLFIWYAFFYTTGDTVGGFNQRQQL